MVATIFNEKPGAQAPRHTVRVITFATELGWMVIEVRRGQIERLKFGFRDRRAALAAMGATASVDELGPQEQRWVTALTRYAQGERVDLSRLPLAAREATPFVDAIRAACRSIGFGQQMTYGELAKVAGYPGAARAVGNVMRTNETPLLIPCHRVVGANGLGGFSAPQGVSMKARLLEMERSQAAP